MRSNDVIERKIRWYQRNFHEALLSKKHDRIIQVAHRRWGKDEMALQGLCQIIADPNCPKHRIGNYWHCLPEYEQARKAIWEGVNAHTGKKRIDEAFPPELISGSDSTTMMKRFKNGSTYQLIGSDRYNATVGSGPVGIIYSEWALANPSAWAYHRPMIEENGGWAAFITTPRGNNHAKSMFDFAKNDMTNGGRWFAELSSILDTGALTLEQIEESIHEYQGIYGQDFGLAMFEQEYLCSFSGAMVGAIFGGEISRAEREGRILNLPIHPRYPVHTAWDLGKASNNPIWCFQVINGVPHIVDFYRPENDDLEEWCLWLSERGYNGNDYVPHDIAATEWGSKRTRIETLVQLGRKPKRVPKVSVQDGINAGNQTIRVAKFNLAKCFDGIEGLKNYRREYDNDLKTFRQNPVKDWSEHIGSSWRYLSLAWRNEIVEKIKPIEVDVPAGFIKVSPPSFDNQEIGRRRKI